MAAGLTDAALPKGNCAVRIMLFVGGPTTEGGGQVVDKELSEPIRSHKVRKFGSAANRAHRCRLTCTVSSSVPKELALSSGVMVFTKPTVASDGSGLLYIGPRSLLIQAPTLHRHKQLGQRMKVSSVSSSNHSDLCSKHDCTHSRMRRTW